MSERTAGGLFLPDDDIAELLRKAEPRPCTEPTATPDAVSVEAGYASIYFVTDPGTYVAELHDALVLVSTAAIETALQLVPILEAVARDARPILVVAPALSTEAIGLLVVNKLRGTLFANAIIVANPASLAADLGCKTHSAFESLGIDDLGKTRRVVSGAKTTVIQSTAVRL